MKEAFDIARRGWKQISGTGKATLVTHWFGLVLTSGLDGLALVLVAALLKQSTDTGGDVSVSYIAVTSGAIVVLFILRSLMAIVISWRTTRRLADEEVRLGSLNLQLILNQEWEVSESLQVSDVYTKVDRGPWALISGAMFYITTLAAELCSALVLLVVLLVLQPVTSVTAAVFFIGVAVLQHKLLSVSSDRAGRAIHSKGDEVIQILNDAYLLRRVLAVMPSATLLIEVERQRKGYASARAKLLLLESLPRYFMEASLAVGFVAIGLSSYFFGGRDSVIPALTVFSAAGFRLLPIVNRIQGLVLAVVGRISLSDAALQTAENSGRNLNKKSSISIGRIEGRIALKLESISYKYPGSTEPVIDDVSLDFIRGLQYAIVGPSGAGKTTLVEILLGLRTPTAGKIQLDLEGVVRAYVPQHTHVTTRSTLENVALEWSGSQIDIDLVKGALASAHLADSVPLGDLNEPIPGLSGGQAQRIGLARALYRNPSFLVLDEATNALDSSTEASITDTISALRGEVTVVVVAHRLSTIKDADMVIYLEKGKVQMTGSFAEVYRSVPAFAEQVDLGRFSIE